MGGTRDGIKRTHRRPQPMTYDAVGNLFGAAEQTRDAAGSAGICV